jgi:copper chaperone CopZ
MKKLRNIVFLVVLPLAAIIISAGLYISNMVRPLGNPDIPQVSITAFQVKGLESKEDSLTILTAIRQLKGITAANINLNDKLTAVTFHTNQISAEQIMLAVTKSGNYTAEFLRAPDGYTDKCPVPSTWLTRVADIFRF